MRTLYFEQITDDRFDTDIHDLLDDRVKRLKELLDIEGVELNTGNIYELDFGTNKQCRCEFYVRKNTRNITWSDIYEIVNSVKPVLYRFV